MNLMKILIAAIDQHGAQCRVLFESDCGRASVLWVGPPPTVGEHRFIELELEKKLEVARDMMETDEPPGLFIDERGSVLVGDVTQIGDDGYVHMEFGCGELDLEVMGTKPVVHRRYRVAAAELKAFDCAY